MSNPSIALFFDRKSWVSGLLHANISGSNWVLGSWTSCSVVESFRVSCSGVSLCRWKWLNFGWRWKIYGNCRRAWSSLVLLTCECFCGLIRSSSEVEGRLPLGVSSDWWAFCLWVFWKVRFGPWTCVLLGWRRNRFGKWGREVDARGLLLFGCDWNLSIWWRRQSF